MDEFGDGPFLVVGSDGLVGRHLVAELKRRGATVAGVGHLDGTPGSLLGLSETTCRTRPELAFYTPGDRYGIEWHRQAPGALGSQSLVAFCHFLEAARQAGVRKVVNVLSHCVYPGGAAVPYREEDVWKGLPAPPLVPYGLGRRLSLAQAAAYRARYGLRTISVILAGVYGPHDNFDPSSAQVMAAMIRRLVGAAERRVPRVVCWGTGLPTREFLHARDAAQGILEAAVRYDADEPLNIGTENEVPIRHVARVVAQAAGYRGEIDWDPSKPDGRPRVRLDTSRMRAVLPPWQMLSLEEGVTRTVEWFRAVRGWKRLDVPGSPSLSA
jgi:GDP-L-fucose synthase